MGLLDPGRRPVGDLASVVGAHGRQRHRVHRDVEHRLVAVPLVPLLRALLQREGADQPDAGDPGGRLAAQHPAVRGERVGVAGVDLLVGQPEDAAVATERPAQQPVVLLRAGEHRRLAGGQPVGEERHSRGRQLLGGVVQQRGVQELRSGASGHGSPVSRCMPGSSSTSISCRMTSAAGWGAISSTWPPAIRKARVASSSRQHASASR